MLETNAMKNRGEMERVNRELRWQACCFVKNGQYI